jgi:HAD superfamily hydrolase (TIGR01509 family)
LKKIDALRGLISRSSAVVFDFDNVIVDSEPYHFEAYRRVFAKRGHTLDRTEYWLEWTSRGGGAEGEIERYHLAMDPNEIRAEKDPLYAAFCRSGAIALFPEALAVIDAFRRAGLMLAIASGSYEEDIRAVLRTHDLEESFRVVIGKDTIKRYKPHPDTYLLAAERLGIAPVECLAIEDAEKGIKSAKAAGMSVILIDTEITRDLRLTGADLACSSLAELRELLEEYLSGNG